MCADRESIKQVREAAEAHRKNEEAYLEALGEIAEASRSLADIQRNVYGYNTLRLWKNKAGKTIFFLGLLICWGAYCTRGGIFSWFRGNWLGIVFVIALYIALAFLSALADS